MDMPDIGTYGPNRSKNQGARKVTVGSLTIYQSYATAIAFIGRAGLVIRDNDWGVTTGKHLNWIDRDKGKRIPGAQFEKALQAELESREPVQ